MIRIAKLRFAYPGSKAALLNVEDFNVASGEKVMLRGPSGSGKSTLLNLAAGILTPISGSIKICGEELTEKSDSARRDFRINRLGFIFQDFALLDYLSVEDNVLLPYRINPSLKLVDIVRERMKTLLESLAISHKAASFPAHLSFGERQRAAIARAMITSPQVLLADEPTANLDRPNALKTIELILQSATQQKAACVIVSHDDSLAGFFDRVVDMSVFKTEASA